MATAQEGRVKEAEGNDVPEIDPGKVLKEALKTRHVEAAVLDRKAPATRRFRLLDEKEVRAAVKDL